ncbi:glutathione S-transferase family protein [Bdellovibrio svalbardensis]|uniref:Glutathione S-transferase family protein n=1 Tax=Bdellovibrio svalbardensis TaxID=2972972 RepID=A0ABT6DK56_9BACT|nr:glutathione S-transferase family protein [Bdellovibrio svalbardensis]MDG0817242.1 glutathione S-transferase family protein [Bdellovibrio svalbardensis]
MQHIDLYCMANQDRSDRVRWLLEELGVPYKDHYLKKKHGHLNTTEYRDLNPMGRVPTIRDHGVVIHESAAICLYLADKFQDRGLAPKIDSPERGLYLQWMVWSVGSLECVIARMFTHVRTEEEKKATHEFVKEQCEILKLALIPVLSKHDYILQSGFSAADIMLAAIIPGAWDYLVEPNPVIKKYMERLMQRPAAVRAKVFEVPDMH